MFRAHMFVLYKLYIERHVISFSIHVISHQYVHVLACYHAKAVSLSLVQYAYISQSPY